MGALGAYGLSIPINIKDSEISNLVDISFCYHETRSYDSITNAAFKTLPSGVLTRAKREDGTDVVEGMYNLQLPLSEFNKKGFYTVYIKPREIRASITDIGTLTAFPDVRGIVLDTTRINSGRQDYYRIITSNNKCEPVVTMPATSSDKTYTYRYEDSSTLTFITVSPSAAAMFKDNQSPYIGKVGQNILLVNTLFEPIQLDIEMVTHDADTISNMLEGSQLRDLDNGLITTFNENDEIYHQKEVYTLKDQYTGKPVFEVAKEKTNGVDFSQSLDDK